MTALQCFFRYWDTKERQVPCSELIRLFETYGCFDYDGVIKIFEVSGKTLGSYPEPPMFDACNNLFACRTVSDDLLQALVTQILDINELQYIGKTLLMQATKTHSSNMVRLLKKLLQKNADVRAVDKPGRNILYHLCYRLSSCRACIVNGKEQEDVLLILQELISRGVLVQGTNNTCSPSEAALMPAAWVLWCQALDRSGVDIEGLLREEDELMGCQSPSTEDIQELIGEIAGPKTVAPEILSDRRRQGTCDLCGDGVGPVYCRPPFDHHHRIIIANVEMHDCLNRHEDGLACRNAIHENSCMRDDHCPGGEPIISSKSRSIRKWAALWLWKNGWLHTPEDAEYWATDVVTQEALDSFGHLSAIRL